MGNITSKPGENYGGSFYLRDQTRFSVAAITVTNAQNRILLQVSPNEYPATRYVARKEAPDETPVEYIADPETSSTSPPSFLLKLNNEEDLIFTFTFIIRKQQSAPGGICDTSINGLTFIYAASQKELDNLVTKELYADPNLHKNHPNVQLVGDYSTSGDPSIQFSWTWKWKPPKISDERGRGWRNCCSFVEYDQRNHRLDPLASFSFWVMNTQRPGSGHRSPNLRVDNLNPIRLRIPSAQSIESRISDSDGGEVVKEVVPQSPTVETIPEDDIGIEPTVSGTTAATAKIDINCQRPGDDVTSADDGPLFRATMKALESKTGNMKTRWKKVLRRAETAHEAQIGCNAAMSGLLEALREASASNAHAVQPAMEHYFDKIAKEILANERRNTNQLQKLIIDPISKLYNIDIKQADAKKRDFDEESKEYYAFVGRYLGQRQDSLKEKKRNETDSKYQLKRRNFELKRFDYSSYLQDLHGGRKDQEILSNLTKYADSQARGYLDTSKKIEGLMPQLEALLEEVRDVDKEFQLHRTEREEKRRALEKGPTQEQESSLPPPTTAQPVGGIASNGLPATDPIKPGPKIPGRSSSQSVAVPSHSGASFHAPASAQPGMGLSSSPSNKFKGIRDLEDRDPSQASIVDPSGTHRKEGLVWALSRPGSHADPRGLNKQAWHKFWIVLDQGKLSEYTNWKQKLDLHMDPIDLRVASVREARNADRRFCFEVITPSFTRVYQATSEDDLKSWIYTINNALQSAVEGGRSAGPVLDSPLGGGRKDFASALTGKSLSQKDRSLAGNRGVGRHATVSDRPAHRMTPDVNDESSQRLLQIIREADKANTVCADCNSEAKVDWVSINLGVIICIECSGIHRSLGTHVSKVRSLTLDPNAFTTDVVEILLLVGNRNANAIWEATLDANQVAKPTPFASRDQRLRFITTKYAERAYVEKLSPTLSHFATPDETLLASIKKNNIQDVAYALALQANPNVVDKSRGTHAIFLALAAADPATPSPASTLSGIRRTDSAPSPRKPFPIAELLLLNGAELPLSNPPIPLSRAGRDYLEAKLELKSGRRPTAAGASPAPSNMTSSSAFVTGGGSTITPVISSANATPEHHHHFHLHHNHNHHSPHQQQHQQYDNNGVGTGGDTLTALPSFSSSTPETSRSPSELRRKRLSSGGKLIKPGPPIPLSPPPPAATPSSTSSSVGVQQGQHSMGSSS